MTDGVLAVLLGPTIQLRTAVAAGTSAPTFRASNAGQQIRRMRQICHAELMMLQLEKIPGGSVRGERANFTRLVLGCIEANFCKLLSKYSLESSRRDLHNALLCTVL